MSRPLKFLHLTTFYPPYSFGGDGMYIYRLAHALGDDGHDVDVVHCRDAYHLLHPREPEIDFAEHPKVTVHGLSSGYKQLSPLVTHQSGRLGLKRHRIREILSSKNYDVIQFHNISLIGPEALTLASRQEQAISLYMTHEHWLICPTHVLWKFNNRPCERPQCFRCTLSYKRPPQLWRYSGLLKRASAHVDQFIAPSRFTANIHAERGFNRPFTRLPQFVEQADHDWMHPAPAPQRRPYFLFVGRLEIIKGLQTVIKLWTEAPTRMPDVDLLIAGNGSYEAELRAMAGAKANIRFLGALAQKELGNFYHHALACIVPSITYETFGLVIIEAFARKTPVIVRKLGALPELVEDSGGGIVYRSEEELISALNRMAASPELRADLAENGYRAFVQKWSKSAHLKRYFGLLRQVAARKFGYVPWENESPDRSPISKNPSACP